MLLTGNAGNDILNGRGGIDILTGGPGNDTYVRDETDDIFIEELGGGTDTVQSTISYTLPAHFENLTLLGTAALNGIGNELGNVLVGNSAKNSLSGQLGNDVLRGLKGADILTGGGGADRFDFDNVSDSGLSSTTRDRVMDFNRRQGDRIDLSTIDANGALPGNGSFQFVNGAFSGNSTGKLRFDAAKHIVYGSTDADTAPEFSILLVGVNSVAGRDFIL